jgi:hypothetical protein
MSAASALSSHVVYSANSATAASMVSHTRPLMAPSAALPSEPRRLLPRHALSAVRNAAPAAVTAASTSSTRRAMPSSASG